MAYKLIIPGSLPNLNDYIKAERGNKYVAAKLKADTEQYISAYIRQQLKGVTITNPVLMYYTWVEPNRKRDKDNIAFARKFIQDALVACGVLQNDGWKHIEGFSDSFETDKQNPRVEVSIVELD